MYKIIYRDGQDTKYTMVLEYCQEHNLNPNNLTEADCLELRANGYANPWYLDKNVRKLFERF